MHLQNEICRLCCGSSPVFSSSSALSAHWLQCHAATHGGDYLVCFDCSETKAFGGWAELQDHLLKTHVTLDDARLRPMKKRFLKGLAMYHGGKEEAEVETEQDAQHDLSIEVSSKFSKETTMQ